jgi:hypothetical protein
VIDLVHAKRAGRPAPVPHAEAPNNVVNLMDALRRSLGAEPGGQAKAKPDQSRRDQLRDPEQNASAASKPKSVTRTPARNSASKTSSKTKSPAGKGRIRKAS